MSNDETIPTPEQVAAAELEADVILDRMEYLSRGQLAYNIGCALATRDAEIARLRVEVSGLRAALPRYEPRVGDRVTGENVGQIRPGTIVRWADTHNVVNVTAIKHATGEWTDSLGRAWPSTTLVESGALILAIPEAGRE